MMLISELEAKLKTSRERYGDLPIMVWAQLIFSYQISSLKESNVNVRNTDEGTSLVISVGDHKQYSVNEC